MLVLIFLKFFLFALRVTLLLYRNGNDSKPKENIVLVLKTQFSKGWAGHGRKMTINLQLNAFFIMPFYY